MHHRWTELGGAFLEAFDRISLEEVRREAKATKMRPLRSAVATILCAKLAGILGPSVPPKAARIKREPKPSRLATQQPIVRANIALGSELLVRRAVTSNNRQVRQQMDQLGVDAAHAAECVRVAKVYAERENITARLTWPALVELASPSIGDDVRRQLEQRILAGERLSAQKIRSARGPVTRGRWRQRNSPAQMAA